MAKATIFNAIPASDGGSSVTLLLYGDVGDQRPIDSGRVVSELMTLARDYTQIDVRINSTGGDVFSGIAIYNALKASKANITIYIDGLAASIAAIIALCGKPLYMSPHAKLMLHNVSGGAWGSASELRKTADLIEELQGDLAKMIAQRCKITAEEVEARYFKTEEDHWLSAQEALSMGLIDGITDLDDSPSDLSESSSADDIYRSINNRYNNSTPKDMAFLDELKKRASFANLSEPEMIGRIAELENNAAALATLQATNDSLQKRIGELEAEGITAFLDKALAQGRITEAEKPILTDMMKKDRASVENLINARPAAQKDKPRASLFIQEGVEAPTDKYSGKSWDELDRSNLLASLRTENIELFKSLFKERFGKEYNG